MCWCMDLYNAEHFKKPGHNILNMSVVLFTQKNSIYQDLGCDCWGIERDATRYTGSDPVIAHPPCRAWSRVRGLAKPLPGERELAFVAIQIVRKNGGVLEHPSSSTLFPEFLPLPGSFDSFGGYSICIDQFWFGHKCRKATLLYVVGCSQKQLPPIPYRLDAITHTVGRSKANRYNGKKEISKKGREATPVLLAEWLIQVTKLCKV